MKAELISLEERHCRDRFMIHANNPRIPPHLRRIAATLATQAGRNATAWLQQPSTTVNHRKPPSSLL